MVAARNRVPQSDSYTMLNVFNVDPDPVKFRTRRAHQKSRMGCFACKRRKRKCDERKPSCTRCTSTFQKCCYPPSQSLAVNRPKNNLSLPSPPYSRFSEPPNASTHSDDALSFEGSDPPTPEAMEIPGDTDTTLRHIPLQIPEVDLYQHYLNHTSHTLTHFPADQASLRSRIPTLALHSNMVLHSLQALSAVCICCDMINAQPCPDLDTVQQILMTGYHIYNQASAQMRQLIAQPNASTHDLELLLASTMLLFPFTPASQQVSHWISSRSSANTSKLLETTPRDVVVMMRGIRATIEALNARRTSTEAQFPHSMTPIDISSSSPQTTSRSRVLAARAIPSPALPSSHTHIMFPIISTTSPTALSNLQKRLESRIHSDYHHSYEQYELSACAVALDFLIHTAAEIFQHPAPSPSHSTPFAKTEQWPLSTSTNNPHQAPQRLTCRLLAFLLEAPQPYLDLVFPLLDQRLANPCTSANTSTPLTSTQVLALDIYAHWSVLMFLVEGEEWWIGRLPSVTLGGLVNRFGEEFLGGGYGYGDWWPGSMLGVLGEVRGC